MAPHGIPANSPLGPAIAAWQSVEGRQAEQDALVEREALSLLQPCGTPRLPLELTGLFGHTGGPYIPAAEDFVAALGGGPGHKLLLVDRSSSAPLNIDDDEYGDEVDHSNDRLPISEPTVAAEYPTVASKGGPRAAEDGAVAAPPGAAALYSAQRPRACSHGYMASAPAHAAPASALCALPGPNARACYFSRQPAPRPAPARSVSERSGLLSAPVAAALAGALAAGDRCRDRRVTATINTDRLGACGALGWASRPQPPAKPTGLAAQLSSDLSSADSLELDKVAARSNSCVGVSARRGADAPGSHSRAECPSRPSRPCQLGYSAVKCVATPLLLPPLPPRSSEDADTEEWPVMSFETPRPTVIGAGSSVAGKTRTTASGYFGSALDAGFTSIIDTLAATGGESGRSAAAGLEETHRRRWWPKARGGAQRSVRRLLGCFAYEARSGDADDASCAGASPAPA
ncbi:hypothetical protein GPECTOR_3g141 [Gonium pectorale]|uniref:Uncharacterized protein n=1 Tax=Gonium pectorale TaxID=33097 RepID=A0A150GYV3_GONPE|nr:hypothetical protein GPECTOR_3g141 [Gonium pectorale]|eukprot:KXZ54975.1 hypothetical protein GPECTOR_3g141 [Gonium pectorale]